MQRELKNACKKIKCNANGVHAVNRGVVIKK